MSKFGYALICVLMHTVAIDQAFAGDIGAFLDSFKGKLVWLRPMVNSSRKAYFTIDGRTFSYEVSRDKLTSLSSPVSVEIDKFSEKDLGYEIKLRNSEIGKARIVLYAEDGNEIAVAAIEEFATRAFAQDSASANRVIFHGRRESRVLHLPASNHAPHAEQSDTFADTAQALKAGYKTCPLCFAQIPDFAGYHEEVQLGQNVAAHIRSSSPPTGSDSLNNLVDEVGRLVLSRWPIPLKGYRYDFTVVEDRTPNAIACPGGLVFLTTGLLDIVESEEELEGILAHELAHIELRHGFRQMRRAKRASLIGGIVSTVVGVAAASKTGDPEDATLIIEGVRALGEIAVTIALSGYSRSSEEEADAFALAYLESHYPNGQGTDSYVRVLRKLQYHANISGINENGRSPFQSHPDIYSRVMKAAGCKADFFEDQGEFEFYDGDGNLAAVLNFQMQTHSEFIDWATWNEQNTKRNMTTQPIFGGRPKPANEVSVYSTLETTRSFPELTSVHEIKLKAGKQSLSLDNKEDSEVTADDMIGAIFVTRKLDGFLPSPIDELELILSDRTLTWRRDR